MRSCVIMYAVLISFCKCGYNKLLIGNNMVCCSSHAIVLKIVLSRF